MESIISAVLFLGLPLVMLVLLKSNVGIMFFAACTGLVLLSNLDAAVVSTAGSVVPGEGEAYVRLSVVLLSVAFGGLVFRETTVGSAAFLSGLIAVILGVMLWLTTPEATGVSWLLESAKKSYWEDVNNFRALVIAVGFSLSLIAVLMGSRKHRTKH